MKKNILFLFCMITGSVYSQQSDLMRYDKPASFFEDALPIGNGRIGGMVYGGISKDRISLNEATLWAGYPVDANMNPDAKKYLPLVRAALFAGDYNKADSLVKFMQGKFSASYAPLGNLLMNFNINETSNYSRVLDMSRGVVTVLVEADDTKYSRTYFVSYPDQLMFVKLSAKGKNKMNVELTLNSLLQHKLMISPAGLMMNGMAPSLAEPSYRGNMPNAVQYDSANAMRFAGIVQVLFNNGKQINTDSSVQLSGATEILVAVSLGTSFNGFDKHPVKQGKNEKRMAAEPLQKPGLENYDLVLKKHTADFSKYYQRVSLDLGTSAAQLLPVDQRLKNFTKGGTDNALVALYFQFGRYLMISSSRTPEVPINLQGIWNEQVRPPWSSNYTININTEMNYWPVETTNLSEFHQPMMGFIKNLSKTGAITANSFYGMDGWVAHHNSDIWGISNPVGDFGKGKPVWANWTMGGTWMSTHLWQHFLFSNDTAFLKRDAYPIMKGAALFCLQFLVKDPKGSLVTAPSTSPENIFVTDKGFKGAVLFGGTADLAMIRELFSNVIEADKLLKQDPVFSNQLKEALKNLHPYQIGSKGNLQEWYYDWADNDPNHRHVSHLFGLYPGASITMSKQPALANAVKRSLELRTNNGTGWSIAWKINLWARLQNGERAYDAIKTILTYYPSDRNEVKMAGGGTYPNLFDACPPFQIDGNFGATAGIAEMLMQSHDDEIVLLPALPVEWPTGSIKGLKARGNLTVDVSWENGKLKKATITPTKAINKQVRYGNKTWLISSSKPLQIRF